MERDQRPERDGWHSAIAAHIDREADARLARLVRYVQTPTDVPLGETGIAPQDPRIGHYVRHVVRPDVQALRPRDLAVDDNNLLISRFGEGRSSRSLLLVAYAVSQHANRMPDPFSGRVARARAHGIDEACVFGRGASQNKGALVAALSALDAVSAMDASLSGTVWFVLNTEGRSSHSMMEHLLTRYAVRADHGILCVGTRNRVSLGNRGRIDVRVTLRGTSTHSSTPSLGANAIDGAMAALARIQQIPCVRVHPRLGRTQIAVYQMGFSPIAPHTLPDTCAMTIDRRLLPGETIDEAVAEIRECLGWLPPFTIDVEPGPFMLPAEVASDAPVVAAFDAAHRAAIGRPVDTFYPPWTFDAGYPCQAGIPTVMFGPSSGESDGLDDEFVPLSQVALAAKVYAGVIRELAGEE